ncbi:MAG TPA: cytochrome P450, partial [Rhodocyclaceae bacterium]|nr:cytochrome P450 [Rhodocyclaceae bacterium]
PPVAFTTGTGNATSQAFFATSAEACRLAGRRGILLTQHPEQLPHPLPDGVVHFNYVPFKALLPRLAAFVHHGGVGSLSQAMVAGVPQLITPFAFDQFDNASRAIKLGVAREVLPKEYQPVKVAEVLNELIGSAEVQASCQKVAAKMADTQGVAQTCDVILKVAERKHVGPLRSLDDLPHPKALPVVGNLFDFKELSRVHQQVEQWGQEYGPLFTFRFGMLRALAVTDHELISAIMRDRPAGFRRPARLPELAAELGFSSGVFISEGEAWAKQRRMIMASFAPNHVKNFFPALVRVAGRLRNRWAKAAQRNEGIDLQADLMRYTVDAVSGLSFGRDINTLESDEEVIQLHLDRVFSGIAKRSAAMIPYWRLFKLPSDRKMDESVAFIKTEISRFIANARAQMQADPSLRDSPKNLLQAMIVATEQADSGLGDNDVMCNVFNLLLAGEDTTANTLSWLIHLLTRNPEALKRATEEVLRVAPDMSEFTIEKMNELSFIEACLNETLRLKPIAPYMPLEAVKDTVIGDVRVPAGTFIWEIFRHDTSNEKYFPNPTAFNPERWLEGSDTALASNSAKRISMPFGAGARACPGRYLAMLEMKLAMAMVLGNFEIESAATPDGGEAPEHMLFTMKPDGVILRLRERG